MILPFLILFIILPVTVPAQHTMGYAQAVPLTEKEGFPGHLYVQHKRSPGGKLYSVTYDGNLYINTNNQVRIIPSLVGKPGVSGLFHFPDSATCWFYNGHRVAILRHDSLSRIVEAPREMNYNYLTGTGRLFYFDPQPREVQLYEFDGNRFTLLRSLPAFPITLTDHFVVDTKGQIWRFENSKGWLSLFRFDEEELAFRMVRRLAVSQPLFIRGLDDEFNFLAHNADEGSLVKYKQGVPFELKQGIYCGSTGNICSDYSNYPEGLLTRANGVSAFVNLSGDREQTVFEIRTTDPVTRLMGEDVMGTYFGTTNNKPYQVFPHIRVYLSLFGNHASSVFSITEDGGGRIWAAGYKGGAAILEEGRIRSLTSPSLNFLNGAARLRGRHYLIAENTGTGLLQFERDGRFRKLSDGTLGYYVYVSRDSQHLYYGTSSFAGLWQATAASLETGKPVWNKIDSSRGMALQNILTITGDTLGRIWCGHPRRGMALYDPVTNRAASWLIEKKQSEFGAYASLTDRRGTVWLGTGNKGLWYYSDYTKPPSPGSCQRVEHPLLNTGKPITALTVFRDWLLVAATDKMLLLHLDSFHLRKKVILRYLNPREAGFTAVTEQNTLLVAGRDSSVWFSTGDMLYQWDIRKWLELPVCAVRPEVHFITSSVATLQEGRTHYFDPGTTSFDMRVFYHSPDLLPRYLRAALIRKGDSLLLPEAGLQDAFSFKNISPGAYTFVVEFFEADGSTRVCRYPIVIREYFWKQGWFWPALTILGMGLVALFFVLQRKRQLAEQKAIAREAQLQALKSEQDKKMADLRLISLSSQFRPHFILNALNTIGAQMDDKPEAESVLSRLGESVSLIFSHATGQQTLHAFGNEWKLVTNIIDLHRIMYLKELETNLPAEATLEKLADLRVPMGILQIPVENALLHGLSNRETGPWQLSITLEEKESGILVRITDNGIGRRKAATLSNYTGHGTGTRNLREVIAIINAGQEIPIRMDYEDDICQDEKGAYGTRVVLFIPFNLHYES